MHNHWATTLLTISDSFVSRQKLTPEERQTSFTEMMRLALETVITLNNTTDINSTRTKDPHVAFSKYIENDRVVIYTEGKKYSTTGVLQK